jgi:hypothetical protein
MPTRAPKAKPAHTPGPWRIEGQFDAEVSIEIRSATDVTICELEPFIENWEVEDIANARLIAAAPELLQNLRRVLTAGDRLDMSVKENRDRFDEAIRDAWKAVTKAETS